MGRGVALSSTKGFNRPNSSCGSKLATCVIASMRRATDLAGSWSRVSSDPAAAMSLVPVLPITAAISSASLAVNSGISGDGASGRGSGRGRTGALPSGLRQGGSFPWPPDMALTSTGFGGSGDGAFPRPAIHTHRPTATAATQTTARIHLSWRAMAREGKKRAPRRGGGEPWGSRLADQRIIG